MKIVVLFLFSVLSYDVLKVKGTSYSPLIPADGIV